MQRQHHEAFEKRPMAETFRALVDAVARGRWSGQPLLSPDQPPPPGTRYRQQRGPVLRRGRVVECIRPVSITLQETLDDPPCRVELKLRWRLEPLESGSLLRLAASYELNGAASFRKQHWDRRIRAHCERIIAAWREALEAQCSQESEVNGQKTGSNSMAVVNVTSVSGRPTFK